MRSHLRSLFTAALIAASVLAFTIGVLGPLLPPFVGAPDLERRVVLNHASRPTVRLQNKEGGITVRADAGRHIRTDIRIRGFERTEGVRDRAEAHLAEMVNVRDAGGVLEVVTEPKACPDGVAFRVDVDVRVPAGTDLEIENSNGNVRVLRGCGSVAVYGRNSDIEIVEPRGKVAVNSTNGRIKVVGASQDTDLETINGSVTARMRGGSLRARTINGGVTAWILHPGVRYCELTTQNGGITLLLNKDCSAFVEAQTERGSVISEVPLDTSHGVRRARHVEGNIGRGSMYISIDTLNGNVRIARSE